MSEYLWLKEIRHKLLNIDRLSHGYIFYGNESIVNSKFSLSLSKSLLCSDRKSDEYCGSCDSCTWMTSMTHPDFFSVDTDEREATDKIIPVSDIRAMKSFFELSAQVSGGKKVALINKAERLNSQASNSLIKVLEEPPQNSIIMLSTDKIEQILPTVKSRCQLIKLPRPSKEESLEFMNINNINIDESVLSYFNASPITAINQKETYQKVEEITKSLSQGNNLDLSFIKPDWLDFGLTWPINVIQKWCFDLFSYKLTQETYYFPNQTDEFERLSKILNMSKMLVLFKKLNEVKSYASKPVNKEINFELIFVEYKKVFN